MFENTKAFSGFSVDDLPKAKQFYSETLGLRVSEANGMLWLHIAGERDILVYPKPNHVAATYTILNFPVDDIDKAVDQLVARGVHFERYDFSVGRFCARRAKKRPTYDRNVPCCRRQKCVVVTRNGSTAYVLSA